MPTKKAVILFSCVFFLIFTIGFYLDKKDEEAQKSEEMGATVPITSQDRILPDRNGNPVNVVLPNGTVMKIYLKDGKLFRHPL